MKTDTLNKDKRIPFTQVSNALINDPRLRLQDIGLFVFMWSKPNDYRFTASSIAGQVNNGRDAVKSSLKVLQATGWLSYQKHSDGTGTWTLHLEPKAENPPLGMEPKAENPQVENPPELIIKNTNNKKGIHTYTEKEEEKKNHEYNFLVWWDLYEKKVDKKKTARYWEKHIKPAMVQQILEHTARYVDAEPEKQYRKDPYSYLYNEAYNNEIIERHRPQGNLTSAPRQNSSHAYIQQFKPAANE